MAYKAHDQGGTRGIWRRCCHSCVFAPSLAPRSSATVSPWSDVASLVRTREQAVTTIRLFAVMRDTIAEPVSWWRGAAQALPDVAPDQWRDLRERRFDEQGRAELLMRLLKRIALDPVKRADALLALDVHVAYLRAEFGVGEGDEHGRAA